MFSTVDDKSIEKCGNRAGRRLFGSLGHDGMVFPQGFLFVGSKIMLSSIDPDVPRASGLPIPGFSRSHT